MDPLHRREATRGVAYVRTLLALPALCGAGSAFGQHLSNQPSFPPFWKKFQRAVKSKDAQAAADLTELPFYFGNGDLDRNAYVAAFPKIFNLPGTQALAVTRMPGV
jgi:hypothetical protein